MKKAAIISMASFYLLLTTGMFVCILHCGAEMLFSKPAMQMANAGMHCGSKKERDCCKLHSDFLVKENFKTCYDLQFSNTALIVDQPVILHQSSDVESITVISRTDNNAPPWQTGKSRIIQFRSIQI